MASDVGEITGSSLRMMLTMITGDLGGNRRPLTGHVPLSANHMTAIVSARPLIGSRGHFPSRDSCKHFIGSRKDFVASIYSNFQKGLPQHCPEDTDTSPCLYLEMSKLWKSLFSSAGLQILGKMFVVTQLSSVQAQISPLALKLGYKTA